MLSACVTRTGDYAGRGRGQGRDATMRFSLPRHELADAALGISVHRAVTIGVRVLEPGQWVERVDTVETAG